MPEPAEDKEIWDWAKKEGFAIVTNDEDFLNLNTLYGSPPPVVLLKIGNSSTAFIANILVKHKERIEELSVATEYGVLEIYE